MVQFATLFFLTGVLVGLVACKCYYDYLWDGGFYADEGDDDYE